MFHRGKWNEGAENVPVVLSELLKLTCIMEQTRPVNLQDYSNSVRKISYFSIMPVIRVCSEDCKLLRPEKLHMVKLKKYFTANLDPGAPCITSRVVMNGNRSIPTKNCNTEFITRNHY